MAGKQTTAYLIGLITPLRTKDVTGQTTGQCVGSKVWSVQKKRKTTQNETEVNIKIKQECSTRSPIKMRMTNYYNVLNII